jgi:hypothetical protein
VHGDATQRERRPRGEHNLDAVGAAAVREYQERVLRPVSIEIYGRSAARWPGAVNHSARS